MGHAVFLTTAVALDRVAPVVLRDERRLGGRVGNRGPPAGSHFEVMPTPCQAPCVRRTPRLATRRRFHLELVAHWYRCIGLIVEPACHGRDGSPRDELANEDHGPAPLTVLAAATDVEPEVHLVEITVSRNRNPEHPGVEEPESDDAGQGDAAPRIELGPNRHQGAEQRRRHLEVEHGEVTPRGGQKGSRLSHCPWRRRARNWPLANRAEGP